MINLANIKEADEFIKTELFLAEIPLLLEQKSNNEVPYTIIGQIGNWQFKRSWYSYVAETEEGEGFPIAVAIALNEIKYPLVSKYGPKKYGEVITPGANNKCLEPKDFSKSLEQIIKEKIETQEEQIKKWINIPMNKWEIKIDSYNIHNQLAINQFAKKLKEFYSPKIF